MAAIGSTQLTDRDKINMESFLGHVLEAFKSGVLTKGQAIDGVSHVILAVDRGDYVDATNWLEQGRRLIQVSSKGKNHE